MTALLSEIADNLPEPCLLLMRSGRVAALNKASARLFNVPASAAGHVTLADLCDASGPETARMLQHAFGCGAPTPLRIEICPTGRRPVSMRAEGWRVRGHGPPRAMLRLRPEESGSAGRFVALTETIEKLNREIRHRKEIEARLQTAMNRSVAANRLKDDLLAQVSHDFRTPLNAIIGFSDFMQAEPHGPLNEKYRDYVAGIRNSGATMLEFVERMLALVTHEQNVQQALGRDLVDLAACLDSVRGVLQPLADQKGLRLLVPQQMQLPRLHADQALIKQILMNLLSNAVEYTPVGGAVGVDGAWAPDGRYRLRIFDNGGGMPESALASLTQPATRHASAYVANTDAHGYGLGLALVKSAADAMGVELGFDSRPGQGTSISIDFPADAIHGVAC